MTVIERPKLRQKDDIISALATLGFLRNIIYIGHRQTLNMSTKTFPYPPTPANVPVSVTEPSPAFKKVVSGVMGSIVLFFVVYLLLFILAIGLAAACVAGGIFIITAVRHVLAILAGVGLIGVGIMVLVFLVKFLFAVSKFDRSGSVEITEADQPKLFAFIRQLTIDTQTPFPKRIYLSPEVNACVFYDSSFWSMFLPVKKNLQIGLGLVNALNLSEFKAVMAHEFGHFSQRSMKLGSFVYQVNRVIYNMLYENNSYGAFLNSAARISDTFAIFVGITVKIVQGIQWVLQKMYAVVNKSYMRLSREMEFHADAVAASVSGGNNCISALQRIELASSGYNLVINKYDDLFKEKIIGKNVYENHRVVLQQFANTFKLKVDNELPVVNREFLNSHNLNRVNFKDQWASHPTTEEREELLKQLGVDVPADKESAWVLFSDQQRLQETLTQKIYQHVSFDEATATIDNAEFRKRYMEEEQKFTQPEEYNGYYSGRNNTILEVNREIAEPPSGLSFEEIFSAENANIPKKIRAWGEDIQLLQSIAAKQVDAKSFDFDGTKYPRKKALEVSRQIEEERRALERQLEELDSSAFRYFYAKARAQSPEIAEALKNDYEEYFRLRKAADSFLELANKMLGGLQPIFNGETQSIEIIEMQISALKQNHEVEFKKQLTEWLQCGALDLRIGLRDKVIKFLNSNYAYFSGSEFFVNELNELNDAAIESWQAIHVFLFGKFKEILEKQLAMSKFAN